MAIAANMRDLVDRPFALDLDLADVLDGNNDLKVPNNRHEFSLDPAAEETIDLFVTQAREGRVIRFTNVSSNNITFAAEPIGTATEGQFTLSSIHASEFLGRGETFTFKQLSGNNWVEILG